ncbi:arsenate reductase (glutaredoxin) [Jannaschia sp. CCS1]|uniref:arsenate reductase (glutaredoxin) n=1 Tax=Jannaschia sp. (strain CCS1) TaxID=290400 RepID=UPI00006C008E|nr:arsenate reductase [Jannaschia sp. CCS1]
MIPPLTLWHNPRCSKSRAALALLEDAGHAPDIRLYLSVPPTPDEIAALLTRLDITPRALVRRSEALYKDLGLADVDDAALIMAMATHPIMIERPILITPQAAAIGRPPEEILSLL